MAGLEFVGVRRTYPNGARAIHGIDMSVAEGEFVVIVGPSGCGKSTLLRMVAGLETVTKGEIRIGARRVNELEPVPREAAALEIAVELVEALGADSLAHGQLAGGGQGAAVTVCVDGARQVAAGEVLPWLSRRSMSTCSMPAAGRVWPEPADAGNRRASRRARIAAGKHAPGV